jgi:hypothetical protein
MKSISFATSAMERRAIAYHDVQGRARALYFSRICFIGRGIAPH